MNRKAITVVGAAAAGLGIVLATQASAQADTPAAPVTTAGQERAVPSGHEPRIIRSAAARVASSAVSAAERAAVHARAAAGTSAVRQAVGDATQVARIASLGSATPVAPQAGSLPAESIFDH
ncbi:hypothetical protein [Streptomyces sp. NPDC053367]|uniref:hypothetical protein n=1 Tax=Streptomyces sp. NPDC053367 TaxID=3365700 RepID=UPI0037D033D9